MNHSYCPPVASDAEWRRTVDTYTTTGRGLEYLGTLWRYLDLTDKHTGKSPPRAYSTGACYRWLKKHDCYG